MNEKASKHYSSEIRERAIRIRMVREHQGEYPSEWATIQSISAKFGSKRPPSTCKKSFGYAVLSFFDQEQRKRLAVPPVKHI